MSSQKRRRKWPAELKLRIVLEGERGDVQISELCRREGISPTQYHSWKKQLLEKGTRVFEKSEDRKSTREQRLEAENRRLKDVVAEITAENLALKKTFTD